MRVAVGWFLGGYGGVIHGTSTFIGRSASATRLRRLGGLENISNIVVLGVGGLGGPGYFHNPLLGGGGGGVKY